MKLPLKSILYLLLFTSTVFDSCALIKNKTHTKAKPFSRIIDFQSPADKIYPRPISMDTSLRDTLVKSLQSGGIHVYTDSALSLAISFKSEDKWLNTRTITDTAIFLDMEKYEETTVIFNMDLDFYRYNTYLVTGTSKVNLQTKQEELNLNGFAICYKSIPTPERFMKCKRLTPTIKVMFWLSYNEIKPIIESWHKAHPQYDISPL